MARCELCHGTGASDACECVEWHQASGYALGIDALAGGRWGWTVCGYESLAAGLVGGCEFTREEALAAGRAAASKLVAG